ncbi:MAG: extracellular solute-binding protein [Myxococcota bacterium]|nr:extracellular solute-binding protein [Myxococcota bacterium]MEC9389502.1 extracellular solute-binding protein [Myxococcota bacterium]
MMMIWAIFLSLFGSAAAADVTLWHAYRGAERDALESLVEQYNASHSATVLTRAVPYDGFNSKLEAAIPRGNGPDLFIAAHERLGTWVPSGLVEPNATALADVHPIVEQALFHDAAVYGYPLAVKTLALFVNTDLVAEPPTTTDALVAVAEREREAGRIGLAYQATEPYFHAPWMHGFDGALLQDDGIDLHRPGAVEALAFAHGLLKSGLVPEEPTGALVTQLFNDGMAAMVINGPWFLGEVDPTIPVRVVPLPTVSATGKPASPYLTVEAIQVSAHSTQKAEARAFASWLVSTDPAIERAIKGRQTVATLSAHQDPRIAEDPILSAFQRQMEQSHPMATDPALAASWEPLARGIRRVMRDAATPDEALAAAQTEFEIVTRPPPPPTNPLPYALIAGAILLLAIGYVARSAWQARRQIRADAHAYRWVAPAAIAMGTLVIVPFVVGAGVSLFAHRDGSWTFVGLTHFFDILFARDWPLSSALSFWFTLIVTVAWTAANVFLHVGIGVALAMFLRAPWLQLKGVYRVLLILPWAIPNYITALIWKGMFHRQFGAINGLLDWVGLEPISWFSQFSTAFAANLITNTWLGFPFMMVVTLGALQAIPGDLEEAASIDGANGWQRFRHVTWPMLQPALLPAVILGSIWTFNMFNIIYLVSSGEPDGGTEILISEAYRWAFTRGHRYGYAAAYAVLIFGVLLLYSKMTDRLLARRVA